MRDVVGPVAGALLVFSLIAQAVVLYAPSVPSDVPTTPGLDKAVHAAIFMAPALLGIVAGLRMLWLGVLLAAHAVASEVAQHLFLAERTGDAGDVVANLVGVTLGLVAGRLLRHPLGRNRSSSPDVSAGS